MTPDFDRPSVVLEPVGIERAPALRNLFQLYAHDFSEHVALDLNRDGCFDVTVSDDWWTRGDRFPFFIVHHDALCGFALARRGSRVSASADAMDVAEFFVTRGARRKQIGTRAARMLFTTFAGPWEVRVRQTNRPGLEFWRRAVEAITELPAVSTSFSAEGADWQFFRIDGAAIAGR